MELTSGALLHALRDILPRDAGLGHARLAEAAPLCVVQDIGPASPTRQREFAAGRLALRRAMRSIGLAAEHVPRAPDRGPLWPCGLVGAITHADTHALAVIARSHHHGGLGLDLVAPADRPEPDLWPLFLHPAEIAQTRGPIDAAARLTAKEAAIKLLRDTTGLTPAFLDLFATLGPEGTTFTVQIVSAPQSDARATALPTAAVQGHLRHVSGHVLALCAAAPRAQNRSDRSAAP